MVMNISGSINSNNQTIVKCLFKIKTGVYWFLLCNDLKLYKGFMVENFKMYLNFYQFLLVI